MDTTCTPRPARPGARRLGAAALSVAFVLCCAGSLAWQVVGYRHIAAQYDWRTLHLDFALFYDSARAARAGRPLYVPDAPLPNSNPPVLALAMLPLAWLSPPTAYAAWTALSLAAFALALLLAAREVGWPRTPRAWLAAAGLALAWPGLINTLKLGQVSLLYAPLAVLAWRALRRDRPTRAGLLWGALVLLKPWLLPVLAVFVARRSWRGLAGVLAAPPLLVLLALPVARGTDWAAWLAVLRAGDFAPDGIAQAWNLGLVGLLARAGLFLPRAALSALPFVAGALGLWLATRRGLVADADRQLGALLALALLASPLGWVHYLPLLLPAFALAASPTALPPAARRLDRAGIALLWSLPFHGLLLLTPLPPAAALAPSTLGLLALLAAAAWPGRARHAAGARASDDRASAPTWPAAGPCRPGSAPRPGRG